MPYHDPQVKEWVLEQVREYEATHFVHTGDHLDFAALMSFPDENAESDLQEAVEAGAGYLRDIRETMEGGREKPVLHLVEGNHDFRIRKPGRVPKYLRTLAQAGMKTGPWGQEMRHWGWTGRWNGPEGCHWIGKVCFNHGFEVGVWGDRNEAVRFMLCQGVVGGLYVRTHTHRVVPLTQARATGKLVLPAWYMNPGTLGRLKPDYALECDTSQWGHALAFIEVSRRSGAWAATLLEM